MNRPAFSVVVPAFNAATHLAAALASVRAQTLAPAEIIVVDYGSVDDTATIAHAGGAHVLRRENGGPAAARNAGVEAAASTWIAFLDADDRWDAGFLERVATAAALCPDVRVVFTDYRLVARGSAVRSWFAHDPHWRAVRRHAVAPGITRCDRHDLVSALVRSATMISTSALAVRRKTFVRCGGFDVSLRVFEQLDLLLRLFVVSTAAVVDEPLSVYRRSHTSAGGDAFASSVWLRGVWERILADPERYPAGLDRELHALLPARLRTDALRALRRGRFADARTLFGEAFGRRALARPH